MPIKRITDPTDFDATLAAHFEGESTGPTYVVFIGSDDPGTGESWCSDCVIADPLIRQGVRAVPGAVLIECPVGDRAVYKNNPDHPYRVHPQIALTAIPTLIAWTADGPGARLVEEECASEEAIAELVASITA
ncbi:thioredoxin fold domain-containing protein [Thecamonas trahens ATCC 50062]|uniref:Thioredoxin fold domain-containing protein n=1 Tax=Thecamonas trahens ATCC 50062 TaxID=461836 RepID=A0A0L0DMI5_THETB|nr:thioredoxin fold domain-containing protein [Thecamonas trahens ATCC 50062]KNC52593.1 thioredoxin fold domain-containing protein [Thecamonas trahens ATCC 50062]|eukprot:XP_013755152.1 thioredoxin fold domain-containing protein [Thecamonas trahens ATCC 50062]